MIITGDFLRANDGNIESNQTVNIKWLYELLRCSEFLSAFSGEPSILCLNKADFKDCYDFLGLDITTKNWTNIALGNLTEDKIALLNSIYDKHLNKLEIIVGFEMSKSMINYMKNNKINYINFILHPVRFYKDLMLCFQTNNRQLWATLLTNIKSINNKELYKNLSTERARIHKLGRLNVEENSCLIVGQMLVDNSLFDGTELLSLHSFKDEIKQLFEQYSTVYFKPHPYQKLETYKLEEIDIRLKPTNLNTYQLLSNDNIKKVYGISSSVLYEAQFLNTESEYFFKYPFPITQNLDIFDKDDYYPIYPNSFLIPDYQMGDLRRSLNMDWGYYNTFTGGR